MRRLVLAVVGLAVLVGGAIVALGGGGGGGGQSADAAIAVRAAATKTTAIHSERTSFDMAVSVAGQSIHMTGTGQLNNVTHLGRLTMHLDKPVATVEEYVDTSGGRMITYVKGLGRGWQKIDVGSMMKSQGMDMSSLMQSNNDPTQTLRLVPAAASSVKQLGSDTIRGTAMSHYRAHVLLDRYTLMFPAAQRSAAAKLINTMRTKDGMHDYDIDLWIGPDTYVHRLAFTLGLQAPQVGEEKVSMTMDLYDFNLPAVVTLPKVAS